MQKQESVNLTSTELAAWRGFLRVHAALARELDRELEAEHGLSLSSYEVLIFLRDAPERMLRMSELAESVLLSQSGITRLVDRLEREGLVERVRCEFDRRGLFARLTDEGAARLAGARPTHLRGVRERFLDRFDEVELRSLAAVWDRILPGSAQ